MKTTMTEFTKDICGTDIKVRVVEDFTAERTNCIAGKVTKSAKAFRAGEIYAMCSWRPEGASAYNDESEVGFFLHNCYAPHFVAVGASDTAQ